MVWLAYLYLTVWAFLLYSLGSATPYLRADLQLSDFTAGLHATALAIGVVSAGATVDALAHRIGAASAFDLAIVALALGALIVAAAPALAVSLAGAFVIGLAGGAVQTHVNLTLGRDRATSRVLIVRANAWAMLAALAAPISLAAAAAAGAWRLALVAPVAAVAILAILGVQEEGSGAEASPPASRGSEPEGRSVPLSPGSGAMQPRAGRPEAPAPRLPGAFWLAWTFIALAVSVEFSTVFWASSLLLARTAVPRTEATLLAGLFIAGMLAGRVAIGLGAGRARRSRTVLTLSLLLAGAGSGVVSVSASAALSAAGLLVAGLGTAALYPVGIAVALARAPGAPVLAAARTTLASGMAILVAPSLLGLVADHVGVQTGWLLVPVLCAAALGVLAALGRAGQPAPAEAATSAGRGSAGPR